MEVAEIDGRQLHVLDLDRALGTGRYAGIGMFNSSDPFSPRIKARGANIVAAPLMMLALSWASSSANEVRCVVPGSTSPGFR